MPVLKPFIIVVFLIGGTIAGGVAGDQLGLEGNSLATALLAGALVGLVVGFMVAFRNRTDPGQEAYDTKVLFWAIKALAAHGELNQSALIHQIKEMSGAKDPAETVQVYNGSFDRMITNLKSLGWLDGAPHGYFLTTSGSAAAQRMVRSIENLKALLKAEEQQAALSVANVKQKDLKKRLKKKK
jgi:hypothetical protein